MYTYIHLFLCIGHICTYKLYIHIRCSSVVYLSFKIMYALYIHNGVLDHTRHNLSNYQEGKALPFGFDRQDNK